MTDSTDARSASIKNAAKRTYTKRGKKADAYQNKEAWNERTRQREQRIKDVAKRLGFVNAEGEGSKSALLTAIADGRAIVTKL